MRMFEFQTKHFRPGTCGSLASPDEQYTQDAARNILIPLITKQSPVSLRVMDWTIVNWSKKHNVVCVSPVTGEIVNIFHAYTNTLAVWKRKLFDRSEEGNGYSCEQTRTRQSTRPHSGKPTSLGSCT